MPYVLLLDVYDKGLNFRDVCQRLRSTSFGQNYLPRREKPYHKEWTCKRMCSKLLRQKGGDLTQSYDKSPYTHGNVKRAVTTQTTPQKSSIKQRLRTDLGRSVGVTTATQLVWLTWFTGPTFPLPATAV